MLTMRYKLYTHQPLRRALRASVEPATTGAGGRGTAVKSGGKWIGFSVLMPAQINYLMTTLNTRSHIVLFNMKIRDSAHIRYCWYLHDHLRRLIHI
mgnify:CR=1 FL=1